MTGFDTNGRVVADPAAEPSLTNLISGIVSDAQTLLKQQAEMLRAEIKEDVRRTKTVAQYLGLGAALTALGGLFLLVAVAYLLPWLFPETLPTWSGWAIVGGTLFLAGLIAIVAGRQLLATFNPLPDKSLHALQENLKWTATNRQN